jgi:hypothetical protein
MQVSEIFMLQSTLILDFGTPTFNQNTDSADGAILPRMLDF